MAEKLNLRDLNNNLIQLTESSKLFTDLGAVGKKWAQVAALITNAAPPITSGPAFFSWLLSNLDVQLV